jgi:hypothetical protein
MTEPLTFTDDDATTPRSTPTPTEDRLDVIRSNARRLRDLQREIADVSERLANLNSAKNHLLYTALPAALSDAGMRDFTLEREGNHPAYKVSTSTEVNGCIAASWPEEKRRQGFKALEAAGGSNLIKTVLSIPFSGAEREVARTLLEELRRAGHGVEVREDVHPSTLKAWLRERFKNKKPLPDLPSVGGSIQTVAKIKEVSDDD